MRLYRVDYLDEEEEQRVIRGLGGATARARARSLSATYGVAHAIASDGVGDVGQLTYEDGAFVRQEGVY